MQDWNATLSAVTGLMTNLTNRKAPKARPREVVEEEEKLVKGKYL